jgi:hypothetical protein
VRQHRLGDLVLPDFWGNGSKPKSYIAFLDKIGTNTVVVPLTLKREPTEVSYENANALRPIPMAS